MTIAFRTQRTLVCTVPTVLALLLVGLGCSQADRGATSQPSDKAAVDVGGDVHVRQLARDVWLHVSYKYLPAWGNTPANGLLVRADAEAVIVDTPWTDEQTARLFDWAERELGARITAVVVTHFHEDCLGGLREAHRRGARSYSLDKTVPLAVASQKEAPQTTFSDVYELKIGGRTLELRYLGGGHTVDNIVVWVRDEKVLFGGCLVKSAAAKSIGNTADADLVAWPATIKAVQARYSDARIVIPGHGDPAGLDALTRTLELLRQQGYE